MQTEGMLSPVVFTEWVTPIVPVLKQDRSVHICGDYTCTVNQISKLDNYPIPKLDISAAHQQLLLDEEWKKFITINTHNRPYQYNRLPFGVSSEPRIFQRTLENLLQGIPHVVV